LQTLIELGIPRVLTSGQQSTAAQGVLVLKSLVDAAKGRIKIMAGGAEVLPFDVFKYFN
jgi:copper homeostasis protein